LGVDDAGLLAEADWPSFCGVCPGFRPSFVGVFGLGVFGVLGAAAGLPAAGEGAMLGGFGGLENDIGVLLRELCREEVGVVLVGVDGKE
jgi:hypothetical protein